MLHEINCKTAGEAERACAEALVKRLSEALTQTPNSVGFMVSGGSTPTRVLPHAAARDLPWDRVVMYASDERIVPPDDADSTEAMVRRAFATAEREARYVGLEGATTPSDALSALRLGLESAPWPPAAAFLGTASDGHVASLFPGDPQAGDMSDSIRLASGAPAHKHRRVTHSLKNLCAARMIAIVVAGEAKRAAYDRALAMSNQNDEELATPLALLMKRHTAPLLAFLAP